MNNRQEKTTCIELEPGLSACVETQAKRRYNQIMRQLLNQGEETELAEKLEMLRLFLESTDFSKLRGEYEIASGKGKKLKSYCTWKKESLSMK